MLGTEGTVRYINVQKDRAAFEEMKKLSGGERCVPVIVRAGKVTIGWDGKT